MIGGMTERSAMGTEREFVCPFVAYDGDRDFRSSVPDHRHRCFAESPAASRALAHQAAYCLSSAFAGCPTFIDWARREAAPPKDEPIRTLREAPTAPRDADRAAPAAGRPTAPQAAPTTSGRQRRAEWTAPPPWVPDAGAVVRAGEADPGDEPVGRPDPRSLRDETPEVEDEAGFDAAGSPGLGAWSGSALGALAASGGPSIGQAPGPADPAAGVDRGPGSIPAEPATPAFLAGRAARPVRASGGIDLPGETDGIHARPATERTRPGAAGSIPGGPTRRPIAGAGRGRDRGPERGADRALGPGPERAVADPSAPSWERPRRFEAYPSLKSSGGRVAALPRPVLYGLIVLIVGVALFATPFVLRVLTSGDGASSSPTPAASASAAATVAPSITPVPSPSPTIYVVKAGDVLSRLAVKFGVTVDAIVKANPQIKNPDRLNLGDQLVIPPAVAPAITDGAITPAP